MEIKTNKTEQMWSAYYGKEPFDLRLTVLRLIRRLPLLIGITLVGTLLFGGVYYVKNVMLAKGPAYETISTYKVSYVVDPTKPGDYYINEMTWQTYVHSDEFLEAVLAHLNETQVTTDELIPMIQAKLASDYHVPSTIVTSDSKERTRNLAEAVELAMTEEFAENNEQISAIEVIDQSESMKKVWADEQPRPVRAFVLGAILSGFFAVVISLLKELGDDGIWLPATLRRRYGLNVLGTIDSAELVSNLEYTFRDKQKIAVCTVDDEVNPVEVISALCERCKESEAMEENRFIPIPAPKLCPEAGEAMREADAVLLVAEAGKHTGKPLEYVLEYLTAQEIAVTATLLWNADEALIKAYYLLPEVNVE